MAKYNWNEILKTLPEIISSLISEFGTEPSLRMIFYRLRDRGLLPATQQAYKRLSAKLTEWREKGLINWKLIRDAKAERICEYIEPIEWYQEKPLSPEEILEMIKDRLESMYDVQINPWIEQKYRVIIYVEKEGEYHVIKKLVKEAFQFGVYAIHTGSGYDSATWKFQLAEEVRKIAEMGYVPVIISLGDLDPSGVDIDRDFVEKVKTYSHINNLIWERIAVTKDQVDRYGLTGIFRSDEEYERFMRDPRRRKFEEKYGRIKVELSELIEKAGAEEMKRILREAIEKYFDWNIYNTKTKKRLEEIKKRSEEAKRKTLENLETIIKTKQG